METKLERKRNINSSGLFDSSSPLETMVDCMATQTENGFIPHLANHLFNLFSPVNVTLKLEDVLKIVCNWSVGMSIKQTIISLSVGEEIVRNVYDYCSSYAKSVSGNDENKLGGECSVVIIDIYPYGCEKFGYQIDRSDKPLFCAAEIKNTPPRYLFDVMLHEEKSKERDDWLLQTIRETIKSLSTIVVDIEDVFYDQESVNALRNMQYVVISLESLKKHDTQEQSVIENLQTIWTPAMDMYDIPFFPEEFEER
ncbi:uncharacterized protein [Onthophagus taurus]|uniref:uncharacterized protein n=1 Tax=Onthophagus taurus TaxID=166361 RepID=UPI0039BE8F88